MAAIEKIKYLTHHQRIDRHRPTGLDTGAPELFPKV
jgi:hypothetical protein